MCDPAGRGARSLDRLPHLESALPPQRSVVTQVLVHRKLYNSLPKTIWVLGSPATEDNMRLIQWWKVRVNQMISSRKSITDISMKQLTVLSRIIGPTGAGKSTVCQYRHFDVLS